MTLPSGECHRTPLIKSTLVHNAVRQQAITWTNDDSVLCCHMASLGHNELSPAVGTPVLQYWWIIYLYCGPELMWQNTHSEWHFKSYVQVSSVNMTSGEDTWPRLDVMHDNLNIQTFPINDYSWSVSTSIKSTDNRWDFIAHMLCVTYDQLAWTQGTHCYRNKATIIGKWLWKSYS